MSGICGHIFQESLQSHEPANLKKMANLLTNKDCDLSTLEYHKSCSLATVGPADTIGFYQSNNILLIFQGTIFWKNEKYSQLAATTNCTAALMEAYKAQGENFLNEIFGSFAIAVVDNSNHRTLLAIDRLGINSLFFTIRSGQLIFSSNVGSIQAYLGGDLQVSAQAIFDYVYFHMIPSPRCIYSDVEKLLPGQCLVIESNNVTKKFYWKPSYNYAPASSLKSLEEEFMEILKSSISRASDGRRVGAFLSGGTDSSTVAGILSSLYDIPIDTYSIGFDAPGYDEIEYARIASRHFKTKLHEYYLTPQDVVDAIPLIAQAYDEPFGNASAVPAYYCAKLAKADGIEVLLAGDGGDELFGGNERYAKQKIFEFYFKIPEAIRHRLVEPAIFNFPMADIIKPVAKAKSYIRQANVNLPDRLESYNFLNRISLGEIFEDGFLNTVNINEPSEYLRETYSQSSANSNLDRMLYLDWKFTLADNDLRKVNRMAELAQIDVRFPLLEESMVDFSTKLHPSLKVRGLKLRYFFKHALREFLPKEILTKTKHGFGLPFGVWMNSYEPLREMAHDSLISLSQRGIVKPTFIIHLEKLHQEHPSYYGVMIWILMMLEQWLHTNAAGTKI